VTASVADPRSRNAWSWVRNVVDVTDVDVCKCCGHPVVADEIARELPPVCQRIFLAVKAAGTRGITTRRIAQIVYADDPHGGPESNSISVLISQSINPRLRNHGLVIRARRGPGAVVRLQALTGKGG
jgi:hypothetical protein